MFGTQEKTACQKKILSQREKKKKYITFAPKAAIFAEEPLLRHRFLTFRGHDFKDFAENFDRIIYIGPRLCMMSLAHTGGLLDIRRSHLRARGTILNSFSTVFLCFSCDLPSA